MSDDKISNEIFVSCLRQLVINCEPIIRDADSIQTIQESLQRLEENDANFYKYELVKLLKSQIHEKLGRYIDDNIEQYPANRADLNHAEMIDNVTSKLMCSSEYLKLSKKLKTIVTAATDFLLAQYDTEIGHRLQGSTKLTNRQQTQGRQSQREAQAIFNDNNNHLLSMQSTDAESSTSSFFNQESCIFLNQDELIALSEELDGKKKNISNRRSALEKLLKLPVVDINCDCWEILEPGLVDSLNEPDLHALAIKFIAKGFLSTPSNIKSLYSTLVHQMQLLFSNKKYQLPTMKVGVDIRRHENRRILLSMRLMNEFQQNVIHFWVRYSENFLEDIIDCTMKLLSTQFKSGSLDSRVSPLHFLAIVDPRADWIVKWTHGTYSRNQMSRILAKYRIMIEDAIKCALRYFEAGNSKSENAESDVQKKISEEDNNSDYFSSSQLDYLYFIHSISMLVRLMQFQSYRQLLNKALPKENHSLPSFVSSMIVFWFKQTNRNPNNFDNLTPQAVCYSLIKSLLQDEKTCQHCFCNNEFLTELFRVFGPLKRLKDQELTEYLDHNEPGLIQLADLISDMITCQPFRLLFLNNPHTILMPQSAVALLADIIHLGIAPSPSSCDGATISRTLLSRLVGTVCQFYDSGEPGLQEVWQLTIHSDLVTAWIQAKGNSERCSTPTRRNSSEKIFETFTWEESLTDNLLLLARTRRGVLFLERHGVLGTCIRRILNRNKSQSGGDSSAVASSMAHNIGCNGGSLVVAAASVNLILSHAASTASGIEALDHTTFVKELLSDIWSNIECDSDDIPTHRDGFWLQGPDSASLKLLVRLIAVHSSFSAFSTLVRGYRLPMADKYSLREIPTNLVEFLDRVVIVNTPAKIQGLFNYELSHLLGLYWLASTVTNLNCLLLLQSQFKFIEALVESQTFNITDNSNEVIIDALSIERNYIIIQSSSIAGPTERDNQANNIIKRVANITEMDFSSVRLLPDPRKTVNFVTHQSLPRTPSESIYPLRQFVTKYRDDPDLTSKAEFVAEFAELLKEDTFLVSSHPKDITELLRTFLDVSLKSSTSSNVKITMLESVPKTSSTPFVKLGVSMIVDYGYNLGILVSPEKDRVGRDLLRLQESARLQLSSSQHDPVVPESSGFDWLLGCLFLLCSGDVDMCWGLLTRIHCLPESILVWPRPWEPLPQAHVGHWAEAVLAAESPAVHCSLRICGYPASQICSDWASQAYLDVLDWPHVVAQLVSSLLLGPVFRVYFCVHLLRRLETCIKTHLHANDLILFIREVTISEPRINELAQSLELYQNKYDSHIQRNLQEFLAPS